MGAMCFRGSVRLLGVGDGDGVERVVLSTEAARLCSGEPLDSVESLLLVITTSIFAVDPGLIPPRAMRLGIILVWFDSLSAPRM